MNIQIHMNQLIHILILEAPMRQEQMEIQIHRNQLTLEAYFKSVPYSENFQVLEPLTKLEISTNQEVALHI